MLTETRLTSEQQQQQLRVPVPAKPPDVAPPSFFSEGTDWLALILKASFANSVIRNAHRGSNEKPLNQ